jgi:ABC-type polysaccharide/polyol phosphate export permease
MGVGWAIFMPLLNTILFTVVFGQKFGNDVGVPYPVFAYCGLLAWNLTASSLRFSVNSLTANINLVAKVYFPREIFPFSAVFVSVVDYLVGRAGADRHDDLLPGFPSRAAILFLLRWSCWSR